MLKDKRQQVADILRNNQTLQRLFVEFDIDFEQVQNALIKDVLIVNDSLIQANTVLTLSENSSHTSSISTLNENVSKKLGLYPGSIESPHESHYRDYISSKGTSYVYLLKWLYYTYKYFNEDQFFFTNLLNHFVPTYDSEIISSTTNLKIYFDGLGILLDTLDTKVENLYTLGNIDEVEERFLQYLGQLLGYQKEDFSIQNISFRELIKNLTDIYKTKGTHYSFDLFFKLLGFDTEIREYYWDRDAQNPEEFGSVLENNYLYYLTIQDPRQRTLKQTSITNDLIPIQPISTSDWVSPKDLRLFNTLLLSYSLSEVLGFKDSAIPAADRFTYFKTNFIQFKLKQFYTKQDLTAKDTETILKYVKFLTPIYVSAFVEVVTTPYEDFFVMSNPDAGSVTLEGNPGDPTWVDILLPYLFVIIRDYIPLQLSPAPESAVVISQHGWSDLNFDGNSDSALPIIFGDPSYDISIEGTVDLSTPKNLTTDKFISLKIDKGRGVKISIQGNFIQTYAQLISNLNLKFAENGLDAQAIVVGITPNLDIRVYSNAYSPTSKILMVKGLKDDLFTALSTTPLAPSDGTLGDKGYQDFSLSFAATSNATGLSLSTTYNFYINVDITDFSEVDASGPTPSSTSGLDVVNALNNHYDLLSVSNFVVSANIEYVASTITSEHKDVVAYRDASTSNGRLIYINSDGSIYRSGLNFTLYDCRNVAVAATNGSLKRVFVAWYDTTNNYAKWTIFDNDGNRITTENILEPFGVGVGEIVATVLSDDKIAVAYNTTPLGGKVKTFNLSGLGSEVASEIWTTTGASEIAVEALGNGFVVGFSTGSSGSIVYFNNDCTYKFTDLLGSTKTFLGQEIASLKMKQTVNDEIFISYRSNKSSPPADYKAYFTIWSSSGSLVHASEATTVNEVDFVDIARASNNNIIVAYKDSTDGIGYFKIYSPIGDLYKKDRIFYDASTFSEMTVEAISGGMLYNLAIPSKGYFMSWLHLGDIASLSLGNKLVINSTSSANTWDDSVDNYADATDSAHFFRMATNTYESDNFAEANRAMGVDFVSERNRYNTFYASSPDDDLIDLIEDTLTFVFTLLIGSSEQPADQVDRGGFYIKRNGYISRNQSLESDGNKHNGYHTRKLDYSETLRLDPFRINKEINWTQWKKWNATYDEWSSWALGIDYLETRITSEGGYFGNGQLKLSGGALLYKAWPPYLGSGSIGTFGGSAYTIGYTKIMSGLMTLSGHAASTVGFRYSTSGSMTLSGSAVFQIDVVYVGSGGLTTSGSATYELYSKNYLYSGSGVAFVFGGAAVSLGPFSMLSSGGAILSGSAGYELSTKHYEYVGSIQIEISGTAPSEFAFIYAPSGSIVISGSYTDLQIGYISTVEPFVGVFIYGYAVVNNVYIWDPLLESKMIYFGGAALSEYTVIGEFAYSGSGSATLSGSAITSYAPTILSPTPSGGLITSGHSPSGPALDYSYVGSGSIGTFGGSAYTVAFAIIASGGIVLGGASSQIIEFARTMSGSIVLSGSASTQATADYVYLASGSAFYFGGGIFVQDFSYTGSGVAFFFGGSASALGPLSYSGTGSVNLSGSASSQLESVYAATGSITISGSATYNQEGYVYSASGVTNLSGNAITSQTADYTYSASGGPLTLGGAAYTQEYIVVPIGGVNISGSAIYNLDTANYEYSASGSIIISGSSLTSYTNSFSYLGSGIAFVVGGAATIFGPLEYGGSGTVNVLGASTYQEFGLGLEYTASGDAIFSGTSPSSLEGVLYIYSGNGALGALGLAAYEEVGL